MWLFLKFFFTTQHESPVLEGSIFKFPIKICCSPETVYNLLELCSLIDFNRNLFASSQWEKKVSVLLKGYISMAFSFLTVPIFFFTNKVICTCFLNKQKRDVDGSETNEPVGFIDVYQVNTYFFCKCFYLLSFFF